VDNARDQFLPHPRFSQYQHPGVHPCEAIGHFQETLHLLAVGKELGLHGAQFSDLMELHEVLVHQGLGLLELLFQLVQFRGVAQVAVDAADLAILVKDGDGGHQHLATYSGLDHCRLGLTCLDDPLGGTEGPSHLPAEFTHLLTEYLLDLHPGEPFEGRTHEQMRAFPVKDRKGIVRIVDQADKVPVELLETVNLPVQLPDRLSHRSPPPGDGSSGFPRLPLIYHSQTQRPLIWRCFMASATSLISSTLNFLVTSLSSRRSPLIAMSASFGMSRWVCIMP